MVPRTEPSWCSMAGATGMLFSRLQSHKGMTREEQPHEQPMACVVGGCTPSIYILPQGLPGWCQQASPRACYYPAPLATSAGSPCGGTCPRASPAKGRDPSPHGLVVMLPYQCVTFKLWHQDDIRFLTADSLPKKTTLLGYFGFTTCSQNPPRVKRVTPGIF